VLGAGDQPTRAPAAPPAPGRRRRRARPRTASGVELLPIREREV
jgi:hypothetical protein